MAVNEDIWGASNTWVSVLNNMCTTISTPMYNLIDNTLVLNELVDNTVCYFGAVQDKNIWYKAEQVAFENATDAYPLYETAEITNCLFFLNNTYAYGHGNYGDIQYWYRDSFHEQWSKYETKADIPTNQLNSSIKPLFNIKLNKMLWQVSVTAFDNNDVSMSVSGHNITCSLEDWISSRHVQYPYLAQVTMYPYYNAGTDENPNWTVMLDSYDDIYYWAINKKLSEHVQNYGDKTIDILYAERASSSKITELVMGLYANRDVYYPSSIYFACDPDTTHYIHDSAWLRYCREYSEELIDEIRTQIAFYGVFFIGAPYSGTLGDLTLTHSSVYCGIIDEYGYTHGDYSNGTDNEDRQQFEWEDTSESNYDPYAPIPQGDEYTAHGTHLSATAHAHGGNYYFSDNASAFTTLLNEINNITVPSGGWQEDNTFYGQEPLSCIIEARLIFMQNPYTDNASAVQLGAFTSEDVSLPFKLSTEIQEYTYPPIKVQNYYNDFRDYSPCTSVFLWFPFCGSLELDTNIVMGHYINLTEEIDPLTGDIKVIVRVDSSEYYTMTGNCACDLSVSGFNMSQYAQTRLSLQMQQIGAQFNAGASLIGGLSGGSIAASLKNPTGATLQMLGGGINYGGSLYQARQYKNLNFKMKPSVGRADKAAGNIEEGAVYLPMIIVTRPRILPEYENSLGGYIAQNGIATHTIGKIGDQTGFVQCENPHVDVTATPEEQAQIAQLLESGIRIK